MYVYLYIGRFCIVANQWEGNPCMIRQIEQIRSTVWHGINLWGNCLLGCWSLLIDYLLPSSQS
jgi:hypothetical protein